jgi:hypothetical protein
MRGVEPVGTSHYELLSSTRQLKPMNYQKPHNRSFHSINVKLELELLYHVIFTWSLH